jgi:hypothetical protein
VPQADLDRNVLGSLEEFFAARTRFELTLTELREFPAVVYAAPEPVGALKRWVAELWERFPEYPPYEGEFDEVIPHATLGTWEEPDRREEVVTRARQLTQELLPLACTIQDVALFEEYAPDQWRERRRFPLGP